MPISCAPTDPSVKAKSQVCLYASWGHLILKMQHSTTRQSKQKFSPNPDDHWSKKSSFLCVQTNWVCPSGTQRFCTNGSDSSLKSLSVTRVESFCEKWDSSRVELPFFQHDTSRFLVTKSRDSSRVIDSSHTITGGITVKWSRWDGG